MKPSGYKMKIKVEGSSLYGKILIYMMPWLAQIKQTDCRHEASKPCAKTKNKKLNHVFPSTRSVSSKSCHPTRARALQANVLTADDACRRSGSFGWAAWSNEPQKRKLKVMNTCRNSATNFTKRLNSCATYKVQQKSHSNTQMLLYNDHQNLHLVQANDSVIWGFAATACKLNVALPSNKLHVLTLIAMLRMSSRRNLGCNHVL